MLDQRIAKKREIFSFYKQKLGGLGGVSFMPINSWNEPNCWLSSMQLTGKVRPIDVIEALEAENIEARPVWKPMHLQPIFAEYDFVGEGIAEELFTNGICLPSDTKMTEQDLSRVTGIIKGLWR